MGTKRDINFYESLSLSKLSNIIVAQKSYGALLYKPINQTPWWSASGFRLLILRTCSRFKSAESTRFPIIHVLWSTKNYTKTVVYPYYLSSIVVGLPTIPMFQPSSPLTIAHCLPLDLVFFLIVTGYLSLSWPPIDGRPATSPTIIDHKLLLPPFAWCNRILEN